jgi:hypothetical protein
MCFLRSGISHYNKLDIPNLYNASGCNDSVTHRELSVRGFQFSVFGFRRVGAAVSRPKLSALWTAHR